MIDITKFYKLITLDDVYKDYHSGVRKYLLGPLDPTRLIVAWLAWRGLFSFGGYCKFLESEGWRII